MQIEKEDISSKDEFIAMVLAITGGTCGIHDFYLGKWVQGIIIFILKVIYILNGLVFDLQEVLGNFWGLATGLLIPAIIYITTIFDIYRLANEAMTDGKGRLVCSMQTLEENGIYVDKTIRVLTVIGGTGFLIINGILTWVA